MNGDGLRACMSVVDMASEGFGKPACLVNAGHSQALVQPMMRSLPKNAQTWMGDARGPKMGNVAWLDVASV